MTTKELYCKGARVWVRDPEVVWKGGELLKDYKPEEKTLDVELEDGETRKVKIKTKEDLPPLRNPEILIGENDLTSLSYLHEPAVLYNLNERFIRNSSIYTYCGIVLVAINPYEQLPLYGEDVIQAYHGQDMGSMDPHIFAVAEEAFKRMARFEQDQSIIVSGESGAGKTVSAKYAMRYFATVGGSSTETQIEKKVLASNPIMEAIGNAKTTRNDNSSRFGKYIEIKFNRLHHIVGANMRTYLLEKSRVVFQAPEERNYHIFYQLCACCDKAELKDLQLGDPDEFHYTSQGEAPIVDGIDDRKNFDETKEAFKLLGIKEDMMKQIFRIIGAVLHFGNVDIRPDQHESSKIEKDNENLPILCNLLGIDEQQMMKWLCNRKIVTVREVLTKPLRRDLAMFSRDALAKHIYSQLFSWIVDQINKAMDTASKTTNFIGVLDIYGFEMFEINSFEQFCINYANEKLQQQFTQHVFKLEQEEYVKEQIEWSFIDYYDNQPCIDMIESKLGILDLLDEECMLPKGSDDNWCGKLYNKLTKHGHFSKPRTSRTAFIIHHFADKVEYESDGFVEKNRDQVNDEHLNILMASQYEFVADLFRPKQEAPPANQRRGNIRAMVPPVKAHKTFKKSVGSQFRDSLTYLMMKLNSTTPHYVRCIKPNDYKLPFTFEPKRAVEQLRACGVLETIRISAAGYPSRWSYSEFFTRYRVLMYRKDINKKDVRGTSEKTLQRLITDPDKYQFGKTKIFFRAGQVAYLEKLRADKLRAACVLMQKTVRGWMERQKYRRLRAASVVMQKYIRGFLARRLTKFLRETRSAIVIQKAWRRYRCRRDYLRIRNATVTIQAFARGMWGRQRYTEVLRESRAITIQRYCRGWAAREWYRKTRCSIILLQCCVRRMKAKKELKQLKIEARSVEHYKKLNRGMENKIISITQKVAELNKENVRLKETEKTMVRLQEDIGNLEKVKSESKELSKTLETQETELERLRRLLAETQVEKGQLEVELQSVKKARAEETNQYEEESAKLRNDLLEQENQFKELEDGIEVRIAMAVEDARSRLMSDFEEDRSRHQKLLQDYTRLEQRFDNLKEDMLAMESSPTTATATMNGSMMAPRHDRADSSEGAESGYGTLATMTAEDAENVEVEIEEPVFTVNEQGEEKASMDISVFIKLQQRCRDLEKEKTKLEVQLEKRDVDGRNRANTIENELEHFHLMNNDMKEENLRLKKDLENLRRTLEGDNHAENNPVKILNDQVEVMGLENEKHRQEIVRLKTDLVNRKRQWGLHEGDSVEIGTNTEQQMLSDEDLDNLTLDSSSLISDYKTVKTTSHLFNALTHSQTSLEETVTNFGNLAENHNDLLVAKIILEKEIQALRMNHDYEKADLKEQIEQLQKDNERQQSIIGENLKLTPNARVSQAVQFELSRLTNENINLMEEKEYLEKLVKKLKKQLKAAHKRLQSSSSMDMGGVATANNVPDTHLSGVPSEYSDVPEMSQANVRVKEREEMMGMLEYKAEEEPKLLKVLVVEFIPSIAEGHLPGLPAYIIFMCIRHADFVNDDRKVKALLTGVINGIKKTVKRHFEDFEYVSFWLTNTIRLLHNLKQYSGEESFSSKNTDRQNEHCLRNFDLSEYRHVMNDLGIHIYQMLIRIIENKIQPMIVSAMLEGEMAGFLSSSKPAGVRGRNSTLREREIKNISIDSLIKQLGTFLSVMNLHGMDPELVRQVSRQTLYLITASTINNILLRKDMCHWSKGVQIRYNLSELEEWLRTSRMYDKAMETTLEPLVQVAQLLQVKKRTEDDVDIICDTCTQLTVTQIIKILNLYTPDEYEKRTEIAFIRKVQGRLGTRDDPKRESQLLIDAKHTFPVTFPYNPSSVELNEITIPDQFHLDFVKKL